MHRKRPRSVLCQFQRSHTLCRRLLDKHVCRATVREPALQQQAVGAGLQYGAVNVACGCRPQIRRHRGACVHARA
jgi:hypothetical protein